MESSLDGDLEAHEVLRARQDLFALGRILAHTKEGPAHLLAEATMNLAAAYGALGLHAQALHHANTSILLSHEQCQFLEHWPFHTESEAPQLWQRCVNLLARLELNKYRSSHHKTDLLKSLAHFETAFPIIRQLRDTSLDEAVPESAAEYLEQVTILYNSFHFYNRERSKASRRRTLIHLLACCMLVTTRKACNDKT